MTEDEAKTKWCCGPKIVADRMLSLTLTPQGKSSPEHANGLCIASACMAWRVISGDVYEVGDRIVHRAVPDSDVEKWKKMGYEIDDLGGAIDGYVSMVLFATKDAPPLGGYCGLAGQP